MLKVTGSFLHPDSSPNFRYYMITKLLPSASYILFVVLGLGLILLASNLQSVPPPQPGEYHYPSFLRFNFTWITASLFAVVGGAIDFLFRPNPWLAGVSLVFIYPLTALYEATVYRGSHNLIPFELIIHFPYPL